MPPKDFSSDVELAQEPSADTPTPTPAPVWTGGATAIAAGVLALLIGLYRCVSSYSYFSMLTMLMGLSEGEISTGIATGIANSKVYWAVGGVVSVAGALALIVGAIMLLRRRRGGRILIVLGSLTIIAEVVATLGSAVLALNSLAATGYATDGNAFSTVLSGMGPLVLLSLGLSVGIPVVLITLALVPSTRRWCEGAGQPAV